MDALVEFYDDKGRCFHSFRCDNELEAIARLASQIETWNGLGFCNASCYVRGVQEWNLEITA